MIYFDTAYIIKCYIHEPGSPAVRQLLQSNKTAACCITGRLEFAAAVKRAVREGRIDARVIDTIFAVFEHDDRNGVYRTVDELAHERLAFARFTIFLPRRLPLACDLSISSLPDFISVCSYARTWRQHRSRRDIATSSENL